MSRGKPNDPLAWAELANRDLFRAEVLMAKDDIDGCMFHLQQACEKHLKGKLVEKGWRLQRLHDIPELLNEAKAMGIDASLSNETASLLAVEYIGGRYPGWDSDPEPTKEMALSSLAEVSKMIGKPVDVKQVDPIIEQLEGSKNTSRNPPTVGGKPPEGLV